VSSSSVAGDEGGGGGNRRGKAPAGKVRRRRAGVRVGGVGRIVAAHVAAMRPRQRLSWRLLLHHTYREVTFGGSLAGGGEGGVIIKWIGPSVGGGYS
jgi:hypothetical protein